MKIDELVKQGDQWPYGVEAYDDWQKVIKKLMAALLKLEARVAALEKAKEH